MFCPNCGNNIEDGSAFCSSCGANLNASDYDSVYSDPIQSVNRVSGGKSKLAAGLLGIFLGHLGIHRMYLGYVGIGILQMVVTFLTCGVGALWGFIEGILILCGSTITTDSDGNPLSD